MILAHATDRYSDFLSYALLSAGLLKEALMNLMEIELAAENFDINCEGDAKDKGRGRMQVTTLFLLFSAPRVLVTHREWQLYCVPHKKWQKDVVRTNSECRAEIRCKDYTRPECRDDLDVGWVRRAYFHSCTLTDCWFNSSLSGHNQQCTNSFRSQSYICFTF